MPQILVSLTKEELKAIERRAKLNYMTPKEQTEDILRRSMIKYKNKTPSLDSRIDDRLVALFSRERKGRKRKKSLKIS